jgi:acylphosphatase
MRDAHPAGVVHESLVLLLPALPASTTTSALVSATTGGDSEAGSDPVRLTAWMRGRVQGVGMRWWVRSRALELGLVGTATNLDDGRVEVVAEGSREAGEALLAALRSEGTPGRVTSATERWGVARGGVVGFSER